MARAIASLALLASHQPRAPSCREGRLSCVTTDERFARLDRELEQARSKGYEAIYRITVLSASIVAFSAHLALDRAT
jgi:hypothetical protein